MKYGIHQRSKPRLNVLRGYTGNESSGLTTSAKPDANAGIKSGQAIVLNGSGEWVVATPANSAGKVVHIATADQTDTDVVSSGLLIGLSCSGQYEIETAFIDTTKTYNQDAPVYVGAGGIITPALSLVNGESADVVGYITRKGKRDISGVDSQAASAVVVSFTANWIAKPVQSGNV